MDGTTQKDDLRGLKALVIGMGVMIVLATSLVIGLEIKRVYDSGSSRLKATGPTSIRIPAPPGAVIGGVTALNGQLAIWIKDGPSNKAGGNQAGGKVVLINPRTNSVSSTVTLSPR